MIMQTGRGSLLTKDCLHGHFYRAQARHEINLRCKFMNGMAAEMNGMAAEMNGMAKNEEKGNIKYDNQNNWNGKLSAQKGGNQR